MAEFDNERSRSARVVFGCYVTFRGRERATHRIRNSPMLGRIASSRMAFIELSTGEPSINSAESLIAVGMGRWSAIFTGQYGRNQPPDIKTQQSLFFCLSRFSQQSKSRSRGRVSTVRSHWLLTSSLARVWLKIF